MRILEVGFYNERSVWLDTNQSGDILGYITTLQEASDTVVRTVGIEIDQDDENRKRTVKLNAHWPKRCIEAQASEPEPLFYSGDDSLEQGKPYLLFAANKIYLVREYAWLRDALEASKKRVTIDVLNQYAEIEELPIRAANLLAGLSSDRGPSRQQIPDDVKLAVWARDGQCCVVCQSAQELQFDHIIPFSLGGSNTVENIQILCRSCNIKKSDKIAF